MIHNDRVCQLYTFWHDDVLQQFVQAENGLRSDPRHVLMVIIHVRPAGLIRIDMSGKSLAL